MLAVLPYVPDGEGYSITEDSGVIGATLDGGLPRIRADRVGSVGTLSAQWTLTPPDYAKFRKFYVEETLSGAVPFIAWLVEADDSLRPYVVIVDPGSFKVSGSASWRYTVSCTLIVNLGGYDEFTTLVNELIDIYGNQLGGTLLDIELFSNVRLPDTLTP